ncbi:hypothetical protein EVA_20363 [gut metagenome]|uniref:Uncharacterized protein n=1 Tax=gut metagenome TaxID=749906 RepID=J9BVG0_9ZZZZ
MLTSTDTAVARPVIIIKQICEIVIAIWWAASAVVPIHPTIMALNVNVEVSIPVCSASG